MSLQAGYSSALPGLACRPMHLGKHAPKLRAPSTRQRMAQPACPSTIAPNIRKLLCAADRVNAPSAPTVGRPSRVVTRTSHGFMLAMRGPVPRLRAFRTSSTTSRPLQRVPSLLKRGSDIRLVVKTAVLVGGLAHGQSSWLARPDP